MNGQETLPIDQGITEISVQGFKSLSEESRIEIRPLTILAGANSSGKSSIMQPLLLMKQTLEAVYDPGTLLINGPNVKFTSGDQLFSKMISSNDFFVVIASLNGM
jgi:AAA15 family ATPase/GTPase